MRRFADLAGGRVAVGVLAAGALLSVGYGLDLGAAVTLTCQAVVTSGTLFCLWLGPRVHAPPSRLPWRLLPAAGTLFTVGMVVRFLLAGQNGAVSLFSDVFVLPAYALLLAALLLLARGHGRPEPHALVDGLIVTVGVGMFEVVRLLLPTLANADRPALVSVVQSAYPMIDTVLVLLVLNLAFTTPLRAFSYRAIGLGLVMLLVGDAGYSWIVAHGRLTGSTWLDAPYLVGFSCFAAAALHPSMTSLGRSAPRAPQPWSRARLAVIVPALLVPSGFLLAGPDRPGARVVLGIGSAVLVVLLLLRAVSAVRGLAGVQERLRHQAGHDSLTSLPNRAQLLDRVQSELDAGAPGGRRCGSCSSTSTGSSWSTTRGGTPRGTGCWSRSPSACAR